MNRKRGERSSSGENRGVGRVPCVIALRYTKRDGSGRRTLLCLCRISLHLYFILTYISYKLINKHRTKFLYQHFCIRNYFGPQKMFRFARKQTVCIFVECVVREVETMNSWECFRSVNRFVLLRNNVSYTSNLNLCYYLTISKFR